MRIAEAFTVRKAWISRPKIPVLLLREAGSSHGSYTRRGGRSHATPRGSRRAEHGVRTLGDGSGVGRSAAAGARKRRWKQRSVHRSSGRSAVVLRQPGRPRRPVAARFRRKACGTGSPRAAGRKPNACGGPAARSARSAPAVALVRPGGDSAGAELTAARTGVYTTRRVAMLLLVRVEPRRPRRALRPSRNRVTRDQEAPRVVLEQRVDQRELAPMVGEERAHVPDLLVPEAVDAGAISVTRRPAATERTGSQRRPAPVRAPGSGAGATSASWCSRPIRGPRRCRPRAGSRA